MSDSTRYPGPLSLAGATSKFVLTPLESSRFHREGPREDVTVEAGSCLSQPAGVPHNVVGQSDDLELIEINMPAAYATVECPP